ncbi:MAG: DUF3006 domain-containing protein [bacterium]|nr:DUF3006 domain-containing protein [bacterium]
MIIKFTIDRFEGDKAVLIDADGTAVNWPKNKLPAGASEGSALSFDIAEEREREKQERQTAQDIINEIISKP